MNTLEERHVHAFYHAFSRRPITLKCFYLLFCLPIHKEFSLKGQLIRGEVSGRRYQRISLVAGLINGKLIAPMTYEETMTSDFFEAWFQKFLLPTLNTPSVIIIIMDNARFHRMGKLELLCEEFGHELLPLPPYSPVPTHLSTILLRRNGLILKSISKRYYQLQYFFRGSFILFLFQLNIKILKSVDNGLLIFLLK